MLIRERTGEGRLAQGESLADIARSYDVHPATIGRLKPSLEPVA
jgi:hypothetical protein